MDTFVAQSPERDSRERQLIEPFEEHHPVAPGKIANSSTACVAIRTTASYSGGRDEGQPEVLRKVGQAGRIVPGVGHSHLRERNVPHDGGEYD